MRSKYAALITALLLLTTACSQAGAPAPAQPDAKPAVAELPPARVGIPADSIISTVDLTTLPTTPVEGVTAKHPVSPAQEAEREKAKADLIARLEASTAAPAPGLTEALVAYYSRPDVAVLDGTIADPPMTSRVAEVVGTKDDPSPARPVVIMVATSIDLDSGSPRISVLTWQSGNKHYAAPITETQVEAVRGVTYQGRPAFLLFQKSGSSPIVTAYADRGGKLEPINLPDPAPVDGAPWVRQAPNRLQFPARPAAVKPGYGWACFARSCVNLGWNDSGALNVTPAGFGPAEAAKRLADTDGNRLQSDWAGRVDQIEGRVTAPGAMDLSVAKLSDRTGARVSEAAAGGAVARVVHISGSDWMAGKGYEQSAAWLLWRAGGGVPDTVIRLTGGAYVDHRVLHDGDRTYLLVLTALEPRSDARQNVLTLFVAQGGKLQQVGLRGNFITSRKSFVSMDGRLLLNCTDVHTGTDCGAMQLQDGKLSVLVPGALAGAPSPAAQKARENGTAKFRSGAYAEAAQLFRQAVELAPGWVDGWNDLSFAYQNAGDWTAALTAAQTARGLYDQSEPALYNTGVSYLGLGLPAEAYGPLDEATMLKPDVPAAWVAFGQACEQIRIRSSARDAYEKALKLDPGNKEAAAGLKRMQDALKTK